MFTLFWWQIGIHEGWHGLNIQTKEGKEEKIVGELNFVAQISLLGISPEEATQKQKTVKIVNKIFGYDLNSVDIYSSLFLL